MGMTYLAHITELLLVGHTNNVYRLSLKDGKFYHSLSTRSSAINVCAYSPYYGIFACAGEDGILECFDVRVPTSLGSINVIQQEISNVQLTALSFDKHGVNVALGTSLGQVMLYDLRSSRPLTSKDHLHNSTIVDIKFHKNINDEGSTQKIISSDKHTLKLWDIIDGKTLASIKPSEKTGTINDVCVYANSGLVMLAMESPEVLFFFIPSLGQTPKWCTFLEVNTKSKTRITNCQNDVFYFITRADVLLMGLSHLVGTPQIKAHMHGFLIDKRLYQKFKSHNDSFCYKETIKTKSIENKR